MLNKNTVLFAVLLLAFAGFYWWRMPRYGTGAQVADFEITTQQGEKLRLSDLKGKMVLVHFWGSWCGPCRKENPALADVYNRYKDKGYEVVSVAIERNPDGWQKAIEKDGITWPYHVMESGDFDGAMARQFNVHSIPALFLVNKNGQLMANNPSPAVLDKMLLEQCR